MNPFAHNIRLLLKLTKKSQAQFGKLFGATRGQISTYIREDGPKAKTEVANAICEYFGITQDQLLKSKLKEEQVKLPSLNGTPQRIQIGIPDKGGKQVKIEITIRVIK